MWAPSGYAGCLPLDACPGYPHLLPPLRFFPWSSGGLKLHSSDLSLQPPAMTTASCPPRQNPERCPCLQLAALAQQPGVAFSSSAEDTAQTSLHTASPWHFSGLIHLSTFPSSSYYQNVLFPVSFYRGCWSALAEMCAETLSSPSPGAAAGPAAFPGYPNVCSTNRNIIRVCVASKGQEASPWLHPDLPFTRDLPKQPH